MGDAAREFYASSKFLGDFDLEKFGTLWKELIESGAGAIFVTESDGKIGGAIGCFAHREIYGTRIIAEEFFWFVREEVRGDGVKLFLAFEAWAGAKGAAVIQMAHMLDLMPERLAKFYERRGFEPIEVRYSKSLRVAA